ERTCVLDSATTANALSGHSRRQSSAHLATRKALVAFYDVDLGFNRVRDVTRRVGSMMNLMSIRGGWPPLTAGHDARSERHSGYPLSAVLVLGHRAHCLICIRFDREALPRAEREEKQHVTACERRD